MLLLEGMLIFVEYIHRRKEANGNSIVGIGEIILLPLDVLKIKRQTNPEAFRGRGLFKIVSDEGFGLYRGAGWTAARNAPGSFAVRPPPPLTHSIRY
jgi:Mitochondrial carrier protein